MRILVLTFNDLFAGSTLQELVKKRKEEIVAFVVSKSIIYKKSLPVSIFTIIKKSGLRFFISQSIEELLPRVKPPREGILLDRLARIYSIPQYFCKDVNTPYWIQLIKDLEPTLIISCQFNQIIKRPIIEIPVKGCINVHKSLLPAYRGMAPIFWALANGEEEIGITIHYVEEKFDTGDIIGQSRIPVDVSDTIHSLTEKCWREGSKLLLDCVEKIERDEVVPLPQDERLSSYYSWPTKNVMGQFRRRGGRFIFKRRIDGNKKKF